MDGPVSGEYPTSVDGVEGGRGNESSDRLVTANKLFLFLSLFAYVPSVLLSFFFLFSFFFFFAWRSPLYLAMAVPAQAASASRSTRHPVPARVSSLSCLLRVPPGKLWRLRVEVRSTAVARASRRARDDRVREVSEDTDLCASLYIRIRFVQELRRGLFQSVDL